MRDLMDVAVDQELHVQISAMTDNHQLNLGKNYFSYQAKDADTLLQKFMGSIGEIKDMCMLPSRIQIETEDAIACLPTSITMKVNCNKSRVINNG